MSRTVALSMFPDHTPRPAGPPTHLLAKVGDRSGLCGEKDPLPRLVARHAAAHEAHRGDVFCPTCKERSA